MKGNGDVMRCNWIAVPSYLFFAVIAWSAADSESEQVILAKRSQDSLYIMRGDELVPRMIYSAPQGKTIERTLVSPKGEYVASIVFNKGYLPEKYSHEEQADYKKGALVIFDVGGNVIGEIKEDVKKYVWSPRDDMVACVLGSWVEGMHESFFPLKVAIYDVAGKKIGEIDKRARDIYWAKSDNGIYCITDRGEVYRYDYDKNATASLNIKGIYISPNGGYYFSREGEWNEYSYQICRTSDNHAETDRVWELIKDQCGAVRGRGGYQADIVRWSEEDGSRIMIQVRKYKTEPRGNSGLLMLTDLAWRRNFIIDLEKMEITKIIDDVSEGWTGNRGVVIQEKNGRYGLDAH